MAKNTIINARITGDAKGLVGASKEGQASLKDLERAQKDANRSAKEWGEQIGNTIGTLGRYAAAIGAAGAAMVAYGVKTQLEAVDKIAKTSDAIGIQTEALIGLQHAAALAGTDSEALTKGLIRQQKAIIDADRGLSTYARAFEELGLNVSELKALKPEEQFARIADAINAVENTTQRAAIAADIYGQRNVMLLNTLALGSKGLADMRAEAEALGLTMSREAAAQVEEASDAMERMTSAVDGLYRKLAVDLSPTITRAANELTQLTAENIDAGKAFEFVAQDVRIFARDVADLTRELIAYKDIAKLIWDVDMAGARARYAQYQAQKAQIEQQRLAADAGLEEIRVTAKHLETLGKVPNTYDDIKDSADKKTRAIRDQSKAVAEETKEVEGAAATLEWLDKNYQTVARDAVSLNDEINALGDQFATFTETTADSAAEASAWDQAWADALADVDRAFIDMWLHIDEGFDDFADNLIASFKQLLATLAHEAITRPILLNISSGMGIGTGAAGGLMGALGSLGGGISSGIGAIGSLFGATGTSVASTVTGGLGSLGGMVGLQGNAAIAGGAGIAAAGAYIAYQIADQMIGANDFSGKRVTFGVGTGSGRGIDGYDYSTTGASGLELSLFTRRADNLGISREQADAMLQSFVGADATLVAFANALGITPDFSGKTLEGMGRGQAGFYGSFAKGEFRQEDLANALPEFVKDWLMEIMGDIPEELRPFVEQVNGSVEEMFAQLGSIADIEARFGAIKDNLEYILSVDTFEQARAQVELSSLSIIDLWKRQGAEIEKFVQSIDEAADLDTLTQMLQARYQTEIQLLGQVMGLLESIPNTFSSFREQITLDQLATPEAQYNYFKSQFDQAGAALQTASSPEEVQRLLGILNTSGNRAYNLLTDEQKLAQGGDFLTALNNAETTATGRANAFVDTIKESANEIKGAIEVGLGKANEVMLTELENIFARQRAADAENAASLNSAASAFNAGTTVTVNVNSGGRLVA